MASNNTSALRLKRQGLPRAGKILAGLLLTAAIVTAASFSTKAAEEGFSASEKAAIEQIMHDYLMENPEVILDAMEALQRSQQAKEQAQFDESLSQNKDALFNDPMSPVVGNPDADVTVVEYFDYNCGYCKKALTDVVTLLEDDPNVKVIFKEMPILSESSREAARWALASNRQNKYYDYHVALMSYPGPKNEAAFEKIGKDLGLDIEKLRKDAKDPVINEAISKNVTQAQQLGIRGTPAFIIGDTLAPGYIGTEGLKAAVKAARKDSAE